MAHRMDRRAPFDCPFAVWLVLGWPLCACNCPPQTATRQASSQADVAAAERPEPPVSSAPAPALASPAGPSREPDITQYAARVTIDVASRSIAGTATLTLAPSPAASELRLPQNDLVIESVTVNGEPTTFRSQSGKLVIELPRGASSASDGAGQVDIAYRATPRRGLVFAPDLVYTNFFTCHWLPCKEEPGDKASFRLDLTLPEAFTVVASGRLLQAVSAAPGLQRLVWEETRPYSPYLFGFAAGKLARATLHAGQTELHLFEYGRTAAELEKRFRQTESMLRFFEQRATVALPHPAYAQVLVPGSEAQEKTSFSLIGKDQLDPILADETDDRVIAHELAHQWWGNLITCKDWSHFWLNEGITTFMVAAYIEQRRGAAAYARELAGLRQRHQRAVHAKFDVKLAFAGDYPSLTIKRAITYSKAALFIDQLRRELGEPAFWSGLGRFTRERAGQVVDSRDFQRDLEAASGRDLAAIFNAWVYD